MKIQDFVTDEAGVISKRQVTLFNKTLKTLYQRDGEDVRFVFTSDDDYGVIDDDFLLANNIGDPQRHNGIVIIIQIPSNQVKIFTGKGLYLKYTDLFKEQYTESIILPKLIQKKYAKIVESWIYDHDGWAVLSTFQDIARTPWGPITIIFPVVFLPFMMYVLYSILHQIGHISSLFIVALLSYFTYIFYREGGFGWLWSQRKNGPWSVFIMLPLVGFVFALLSLYGWILSGMIAFACIYLGTKYYKKHYLGLGFCFLIYTTIVFFPSTCAEQKCITHIGSFDFYHTGGHQNR